MQNNIVYEEVAKISGVTTSGTPFIARVSRPVLSEEEKARRFEELKRATAQFAAEAIRVGAL